MRAFRKNPLLAVLATGIAFVFAVLGQALLGQLTDGLAGKAVSESAWLTIILLFALILSIALLVSLRGSVEELTRRAGLSVEYYRLDPGAHSEKRDEQARALYAAARSVIEYAKEDGTARIYAVNSFVEIGKQVGDQHVTDHSVQYLESLNRKLGKATYHRIVQLPERDMDRLSSRPGESISGLVAKNYLEHYGKIVDTHRGSGQPAVLEAVLAKYPTSFVLVQNPEDGQYGGRLIWQMHQHADVLDRGDEVLLTGVYIVRDPDGVMVDTFVRWFRELYSEDRRRVRLTRANLNHHE